MQFVLPRQPELHVGAGILSDLPETLARRKFETVAIVTGGRSVRGTETWSEITNGLVTRGIEFLDFTVRGEPSPDTVDRFRDEVLRDAPACQAVVAIGGGSVIDAGKALAALLAMTAERKEVGDGGGAADATGDAGDGGSVGIGDYLEGVGTRTPTGATLPLIVAPTTAGTGSEATKNAVLSSVGPDGFKKSLRHDNYIPRVALIDPVIHLGCPDSVTRASGLDAITQLIEVYLSVAANPLTDALALEGLRRAGHAFPRLLAGEDTPELRTDMALAAYISGVGLAAVGLGVVHGVASPLGARHAVPHGVVGGLCLAPSIAATVAAGDEATAGARRRYAEVAVVMEVAASDAGGAAAASRPGAGAPATEAVERLVETLGQWAESLPRLGEFGFTAAELRELAAASGVKNHPVPLSAEEIAAVLGAVL
ncbi:MAG: iron-containing alcohol dehydrogenase [Spirochaeta sp.]|jgi:alcohol dehydrogenase|nr:iron-containing alcohol dehydrogenase [Spirochaeta sp.]